MKSRDSIMPPNQLDQKNRVAESDLIARILSGTGRLDSRVLLGPGDDGAIFENQRTAISTDLTIEGVHFNRSWVSLPEVGYRAVMAAISDLAAMAADPFGLLISVAIPSENSKETLENLSLGFHKAITDVGVSLIGGDMSSSPGPIMMDVTVLGETDDLITRKGICPGNEVWVTGVLGGSSGAVKIWLEGGKPPKGLRSSFVRPPFRVAEARWLANTAGIKTMIDISDGLLKDAGHLANASGMRIVLESNKVPLHPDLDSNIALPCGISGGEDYELCLVSEKDGLDPFVRMFQEKFEVELTRVGYVEEGSGIEVIGKDSELLQQSWGFDHFSTTEL